MSAIELGTARAQRGQKALGQLRVREGGKSVDIAVAVINGSRPGKHAVLVANQHGTEVNGIESIRRFYAAVDPRAVRGTIFAVPSANPHAAWRGQACWSESKKEKPCQYQSNYNMNFIWPGKKNGLLVERAVYELWQRAIMAPHRRADFVLDLHCHDRTMAVYADDVGAIGLGIASGAEVISYTRLTEAFRKKERQKKPIKTRCLTYACAQAGIPSMVIELNGQGAMTPAAIEEGERVIFNLLKALGIVPGRPELLPAVLILDPWRDQFVSKAERRKYSEPSYAECKAKCRGLYVPCKGFYEQVRRGELLGEVINPYNARVIQQVKAKISGAIYDITRKAVCKKGDNVARLAAVRRVNPAAYVRAHFRI